MKNTIKNGFFAGLDDGMIFGRLIMRANEGKTKHANSHRFIDKSFKLSICLIKTQLDAHTQAHKTNTFLPN